MGDLHQKRGDLHQKRGDLHQHKNLLISLCFTFLCDRVWLTSQGL